MKFIVSSLEETKKLAQNFAKELKIGQVVLLNGDLGAGKTTFTQFVFAALGVKDVVGIIFCKSFSTMLTHISSVIMNESNMFSKSRNILNLSFSVIVNI